MRTFWLYDRPAFSSLLSGYVTFHVAENWFIVLLRCFFDRSHTFLLFKQEPRALGKGMFPSSRPQSVSRSGLIVDNMTSPMLCKVLWEGNETLFQVLSGEQWNRLMRRSQAAKFKPPEGLWPMTTSTGKVITAECFSLETVKYAHFEMKNKKQKLCKILRYDVSLFRFY